MPASAILAAIEKIDEADTVAAADKALRSLMDSYGFDFYGVVRNLRPIQEPMGLVLAGRFPEGWAEIYIRKKYLLIDPTVRYLGLARRGFRWRDTVAAFADHPHRRRMERMMAEARKFGLEDGYIFPVHGRRGLLGNMTVGGAVIDLSPLEMTLFDAFARSIFWRLIELRSPHLMAELSANTTKQMTHREMEALHFLSDGMTSPEIAGVLEISNHTVDWYMNGIQSKLRARNRHHAVALAFRLGLIS